MTIQTIQTMTRQQLETAYTDVRVAKWGEAEREGVAEMAASKSLEALRADVIADAVAAGTVTEAEADAASGKRIAKRAKRYQAVGNFDDGGLT